VGSAARSRSARLADVPDPDLFGVAEALDGGVLAATFAGPVAEQERERREVGMEARLDSGRHRAEGYAPPPDDGVGARMNISMLLEMAADGLGDRIAIGPQSSGDSYAGLLSRARKAAQWFKTKDVAHIALVDLNTPAVPLTMYGAALADKPFVPLNYRLKDEQLQAILKRIVPAVAVVDAAIIDRVGDIDGLELIEAAEFLRTIDALEDEPIFPETGEDDIAVLLFTSGTTGEPKAAILRHANLTSYVLSTVEFMGAEDGECALMSVPPYHIASISAFMTGVYNGRRIMQLPSFDEESWVKAARDENVTFAMVVPTMLKRILDVMERDGIDLPALKQLSYGGGVMPVPVIERALKLLPHVDFVNAYGLTETSSTVALLGPDDHREAIASVDPKVRARLGSVGRPLPTIELDIRDDEGHPVPVGQSGEIWVRGDQVSGEYVGKKTLRPDGWFPTNDGGHFDEEGFLYVEGRLDDVIVRGGENMSPGEIEEVLLEHPAVADAGVCGIPDEEWGEVVAAAVVLTQGHDASIGELSEWIRDRLRSTRVPEHMEFRDELPYNDMGKLLRRVLREELAAARGK
jgi:fatty-acyl-CoA synthase